MLAGDSVVAVAVVPNLLVLLGQVGLYKPLWLIFGKAEAPLEHGLLLAVCWLISATFTRMFDDEVLGGSSYQPLVWWRLFLAFFVPWHMTFLKCRGALSWFAKVNAWLLFFATYFLGLFQPFTQADVLRLGIDREAFGTSGLNVDLKVMMQIIDLNLDARPKVMEDTPLPSKDLVLEAVLLGAWRLWCAGLLG